MTTLQLLKKELSNAKFMMKYHRPLRNYLGNQYHYWEGVKKDIERQIEKTKQP